jgi:hypothetical protein
MPGRKPKGLGLAHVLQGVHTCAAGQTLVKVEHSRRIFLQHNKPKREKEKG